MLATRRTGDADFEASNPIRVQTVSYGDPSHMIRVMIIRLETWLETLNWTPHR